MYRLTFLLLCFGLPLLGQTIKGGQEMDFAFKVKQIDEFMDRFNHASYTLALRQYPGLSHRENLYSLFNQDDESWDYSTVEQFVEEMLTRSGEKILDFYDSGWYAELKCSFVYRGVPRKFTLVLQNQLSRNGGSKWVIVSVLQPLDETICKDIPKAKNAGQYLHPMSHVTNFIELERAFEDKENLQNFFDPWNQGMDFLAFKNAILSGALKHQSNHHITYHFLQLDNWIFTVDYFPRQGPNAGWLISSLQEASKEDKRRYRSEKLNLL